ncbi:MAG: methylmalonyl Co-A mutase-associated GTPase MeaB [Balneolaceae bacterium]|nr:MAG: methylmalonyl Co-A mutase-associated GTPase MeaB [Balneolaceae bacterium]
MSVIIYAMPDNNHLHNELSDSVNPAYHQKPGKLNSAKEYADGIQKGNRAFLSRAITLIESTKNEYRELGYSILEKCYDSTGNSIRIGITGVPGVGKSTFIEKFGTYLIGQGKKVAVLTIDPSSSVTKGSILGDKTRMETLAVQENAFIRPTPTAGALGGVAGKTREVILLCEAAGFDTIIVETVGVGQSEISVKTMVDFFLLLMLAGAGDELQGIKRGIMETADLVIINKADGQNIENANRARSDYQHALSLFPPHPSGWKTPVQTASSIKNYGINEAWEVIKEYYEQVNGSGYFINNRREQLVYWLHEAIESELKTRFFSQPNVRKKLAQLENEVLSGSMNPARAASELIKLSR